MKTRIGTCHFRTFYDAVDYYRDYGWTRNEVLNKVDDKEIYIGPPSVNAGESLGLDSDNRYFITCEV